MNREQILAIYDEGYAQTYDQRYILNDHYRKKSEFETQVLAELLQDGGEWLDAACGTGYFLSRFPGLRRAGFDISPAMLAVARQANPDALFLEERDFTDDMPEWRGRWDLVSCMWYSYGLVESVSEVERLIGKFASWLSPRGACFVPLCDPEYLGRVKVPYVTPDAGFPPGRLLITGVTWTWEEESGKAHLDMVAPPVEHMITIFERYFRDVEVVEYPRFKWFRPHRRKGLIGRAPASPGASDRGTASQA